MTGTQAQKVSNSPRLSAEPMAQTKAQGVIENESNSTQNNSRSQESGNSSMLAGWNGEQAASSPTSRNSTSSQVATDNPLRDPGHSGRRGSNQMGAVDETKTEAQDGAVSSAANRGNVANADAELRPGGGLGVVGGEDALSATLVKLGSVSNFDAGCQVATSDLPHVATDTATRGESPVSVTKQTIATRGKSRPVVEAGKGSKGTWQLRLRWNSEPGRPACYVISVADSTYELIRKGDYEAYKKSLIAEHEASAISADNTD